MCQKTTLDWIQTNDKNIDRVDHFHQHALASQSYITYWVDITYGNVTQFWFICCLMLEDHFILDMPV